MSFPPFLVSLHLAGRAIKYAVSYPAKIIVLLVITASAHLARMISRKRRVFSAFAYVVNKLLQRDPRTVCI